MIESSATTVNGKHVLKSGRDVMQSSTGLDIQIQITVTHADRQVAHDMLMKLLTAVDRAAKL